MSIVFFLFRSCGGFTATLQVTSNNGWPTILAHFCLPGEIPQQLPVAQTLGQCYMTMLHPFEEMYKRNVQEQQKRAQISRQGGVQSQHQPPVQGRPVQVAGSGSQSAQLQRGPQGSLSVNGAPQFTHAYPPHQQPSSANLGLNQSDQSTPHSLSALPDTLLDIPQANGFGDGNLLDQEVQGIKRKIDFDLEDTKRVRQKTGSCCFPLQTTLAYRCVPGSEPPEAAVCCSYD
jgi:SWI/SNF chromatin-remodeling complex subunit SWI1